MGTENVVVAPQSWRATARVAPATHDREYMIRTLAPQLARRIPPLPPVDSATRSSIRIVVVDDERTLRESCHSVLEAEGYNVALCGRGNEARDTLRRRPFDIALVDWFMGEVPGSELLRMALATNPGAIVIIMTGNPSVASSLEALQAGAWDYLPKPFSGTQLQILIGRAAHAVLVARESRVLEEQRDRKSTRLNSSHGYISYAVFCLKKKK